MASYTAIAKAKDGSDIPFCDSHALHSSYNPLREAEQFAAQFPEDASFFVILGIAGGYHLEALLRRYPSARIIAIETDATTLAFLRAIPCVTQLQQNKQLVMGTVADCATLITRLFRPAKHTTLQVAALRAWQQCFPTAYQLASSSIQQALQAISADFSVQSHFGALWQRNSFVNLSRLTAAPSYVRAVTVPKDKIAAIIAAGPSLDESIAQLQQHRERYYIIATDTAYTALHKRALVADAVVSVDAQQISHAHFFYTNAATLFVFDITANTAAVRTVAQKQLPFTFIETGHPIAQLAATYSGSRSFPHLETGSGTVTIAAAAFAVQAGFTTLAFFGADFAYSNGKPYTAGSYLDDQFFSHGMRTKSAEQYFCAIMYRTKLVNLPPQQHIDNARSTKSARFTTEVLQSYERTLQEFLQQHGFVKQGDCYKIATNTANITSAAFSYDKFLQAYQALDAATAEIALLPYVAWLQKHRMQKSSFSETLCIARTQTLVYTRTI